MKQKEVNKYLNKKVEITDVWNNCHVGYIIKCERNFVTILKENDIKLLIKNFNISTIKEIND